MKTKAIRAALSDLSYLKGMTQVQAYEELEAIERKDSTGRAEGFARAREMAAEKVAEWGDGEPLDIIFRRIRAMQDDGGGE